MAINTKQNIWTLIKNFPRALFLYVVIKISKRLVNWRNKPTKILLHPHRKLKRVSTPFDFTQKNVEQKLTRIVSKMASSLRNTQYGMRLGLAAPQIGINQRIFIAQGVIYINPIWTSSKAPPNRIQEGCYSVPDRTFLVPRADYGWAKWQDMKGKHHEEKMAGLKAIIFQHEIDHLDGKCCIDTGEEILTK